MDEKELELLIENFPNKKVLRRYKTYIENKEKSFTKIYGKYKDTIDNDNICVDSNEKHIKVDAFIKSIRKIENDGVESIFYRRDIIEFAMFINPICINAKVNSGKIKEYIKKKFKLRLETGKDGNYEFIFGERFGSEETFRKELLKHMAICKKKIIDISSLKNKRNIYIIDTYTKDNYHLHIKYYKYNGCGIEKQMEDMYESRYLKSYIDKIEKGIIDYNVMKRRSIISNQCRKKIKEGLEYLGHNGENYLLISPFSIGIINSFIYNNDKISFELVEGDLKKLY